MHRKMVVGVALLAALLPSGGVAPAVANEDCTQRILVLSAFPAELDPLLRRTTVERVEVADGRAFYVGTLEGHPVVLALSGIGLTNADETTRTALDTFTCDATTTIGAIVFSGVSGGPNIGDVMVPETWTLDGETHSAVDEAMLTVAESVADEVTLLRAVPLGDPACTVDAATPVTPIEVLEEPQIRIGGSGASSDGFDGRTLPCFPGGGDVFGCRPCSAPVTYGTDPARSLEHAAPFIDPAFFFEYFDNAAPPPGDHIAVDMETAAVARVAEQHDPPIPFIAFRSASDGGGDPLHLPGFPFQFFAYRILAAENAAIVARAFLAALP